MIDNAFDPGTITVATGTTVTWSNIGQLPHTVTARDESFDSGFLMTGDSYRLTFNTPGPIDYFCTIHPEMVGTIIVTGAAVGGGGAPTPEPPATLPGRARRRAHPAAAPPQATRQRTRSRRRAGVRMIDNDFDPNPLTVEAGATVRWTNAGQAPHTVTAEDGEFDSGIVDPGGDLHAALRSVGTFAYLCTLHPGMIGSIEVVPIAAEPALAGVSSVNPTEPMSPLIAFILAGGMLAVMVAFTIGMARFSKAADEQR